MEKLKIKNVLMVCTGNSCRSVMAEGYLKKRLNEENLDITVSSAGTATFHGLVPTKETIDAMKEKGIDVSAHRAVPLTLGVLKKADVVLVMENHHREMVLQIDPSKENVTFFLRDFDENADEDFIPDPIGMGSFFYGTVLNVIIKSVEGFIKWLKKNQQ